MLFESDADLNMFLQNFNVTNNAYNNLNNNKLVNQSIGLQRGNMFKDEYKPYKNISPDSIVSTNEKDALLIKLFELDFAITDIALYLDLHKEDNEMYNVFQNYVENFEKYKKMYEEKYGPLKQDCIISSSYEWPKNPWPWDKDGGIKYV